MIKLSPPQGGQDATPMFLDAVYKCLYPKDLPAGFKHNLKLEEGEFNFKSNLSIDLSSLGGRGWKIFGSGGNTVLNFMQAPDNMPAIMFTCGAAKPIFYFDLLDLAVIGRTKAPLPLVMLGRGDFVGEMNVLHVERVNFICGGENAGPAIEVNNVFGSSFDGIFSSAGKSGGMRLRQVQFSKFFVSCCSNGGGPYLHITGGYNISNHFQCPDIEGAEPPPNSVGLLIDSPNAIKNVFSAPYFSNLEIGVRATAGRGNKLDTPMFSGSVRRSFAERVGLVVEND